MTTKKRDHSWFLNLVPRVGVDSDLLLVHELGRDTIRACYEQAQALDNVWGAVGHPEYALKAYRTLAYCLQSLMQTGFGDLSIARDDTLSLYARSATGYEMGMIFHRASRPDLPHSGDIQSWVKAPMLGRYCGQGIGVESGFCGAPIVDDKPTCTGHQVLPYVMPVPGEWSMHS